MRKVGRVRVKVKLPLKKPLHLERKPMDQKVPTIVTLRMNKMIAVFSTSKPNVSTYCSTGWLSYAKMIISLRSLLCNRGI